MKVERVQALALQDKKKPLEFLKSVTKGMEFENTEFLNECQLFVKGDFAPFDQEDAQDIIESFRKNGDLFVKKLMDHYSLVDLFLTREEAEAVIEKAKREA